MIRVRLTRIVSSHDNLRTGVVEGTLLTPLEIGYRIHMECDRLDTELPEDYHRYITTTPIESVEGDVYKTANSTYRIEVIE